MIYIGTSGYGYHDWMSSFYPRDLAHQEYLSFYTKRFSCCELDFTCYRVPTSEEQLRLLRQSEAKLTFTVKAHRRLTHERDRDLCFARSFAASLGPLYESGKLGAVLAQFPQAFTNNPGYRAYVCRLRAAFDRIPLVAEFRHPGWFNEETLDFLRGWGIGLATTDGPELPSLPGLCAITTTDVGYVRFHGRNSALWWQRDGTSRYDYDYGRRELLAWLPRLREMERRTRGVFVLFNNHWRGHAAANALALQQFLNQSRARAAARRLARPRPAQKERSPFTLGALEAVGAPLAAH